MSDASGTPHPDDERPEDDDALDEELEETFPASDPPSNY